MKVDTAAMVEAMAFTGHAAGLSSTSAPVTATTGSEARSDTQPEADGRNLTQRKWEEQALTTLKQEADGSPAEISGLTKEDMLHLELGLVSEDCRQAEDELWRPGEGFVLDTILETIREQEEEHEEWESQQRVLKAEAQSQEAMRREVVAAFLCEHGFKAVDGKIRRMMKTTYPLHIAAEKGDARIVEFLLCEGADPAQKNSRGQTPKQVAKQRDKKGSHVAVLQALAAA